MKQARAKNITLLSEIGKTSKAAAKSSSIPAPHKIVLMIHKFLFSISASFCFYYTSQITAIKGKFQKIWISSIKISNLIFINIVLK